MKKKKIISTRKPIIIFLVIPAFLIISAGLFFAFYFNRWLPNPYFKYENRKFGFSFYYPRIWYLLKGDKNANIIQISSINKESGDGGIPLGARIEIIISKNKERLSLKDYVRQISENVGPELISEEEIKIAKTKAIRKVFAPKEEPVKEGPPISVYTLVADDNYFAQINYLGREPDYTKGLVHFERLLTSFQINPLLTDLTKIKTKEECLKRGGRWWLWSHWQVKEECDLPYPDGGEECYDETDCISRECLYTGKNKEEEQEAVGECASFTSQNCVRHYYFVKNGKIVKEVCIE